MHGFKSWFGLKMAGVGLGVGCRAVGEAGGGGRVGGGSFLDRKDSASLTLSSYLAMVVSAVLSNSDVCLFRYSAIT